MKYKTLRFTLFAILAVCFGSLAVAGIQKMNKVEGTNGEVTIVTAEWSWKNNLPEGIRNMETFQGNTGSLASTVEGIELFVDATKGKLGPNGDNAQFNAGTILRVPVVSIEDVVTVIGYPGLSNYTIGGGETLQNENSYTAKAGDVKQGYVEIVSVSGGGYLYGVKVEQHQGAAGAPERLFTDFSIDLMNSAGLTGAEIGATNTKGIAVTNGVGTLVASDDASSVATITGGDHQDAHGWTNFVATVPVDGPVKIIMGTCNWGGNVTVKNAEGTQVVKTFTTYKENACYHQNTEANVVVAYYGGEATTLTIAGGSYVPYFAMVAVEADEIPSDINVTYAVENGVEGITPAATKVEIGKTFKAPVNYTLFVEGKTLTGWSDGSNTYAPGQDITAGEDDITLTAVFTDNAKTLADRTEAVAINWNLEPQQGVPAINMEGKTGFRVAQATIGDATIDVKLLIDATSGKLNNDGRSSWCQANTGTKFTLPSCKGATVAMKGYGAFGADGKTATTIDGQSDYTSSTELSYTVASSAETIDVVLGNDCGYLSYIKVTLPVVQSQGGGESFANVAGTINWLVGNEQQPTISDDIANAISSASVSAGSDLTVESAKYFDTDMVKYTPKTNNAGNVEGVMVEYRVKPAKGITFQPTQIDYAAVKVGTDNATYSWSYTVDGVESAISRIDPKPDLLRNNGTNSIENGGTAKLMHTETFEGVDECSEFTFRFYISECANNKNICIGNVTISGIVNGEAVSVNMYNLATIISPEEAGSINVYPVSEQYEEGSEVTLTAIENFGYDFVNWTNAAGEVVSTETKFKYTMNADETLTANFKAVETYELALTVDGTNDYMVTVNPAPTIVDGKWMYEAGTAVQLTANQYEGLVTFTNWSDGDTNSGKLISMDSDLQFTAVYAQADIIAGWDFYKKGGDGRMADFYAQDNDGDALVLMNTETGDTSGWLDKSTEAAGGYESFKGAAVNWRTGSSNGDVGHWHWQTKVNAEAFTDINVQFQMLYNYNAYQTYDVEFSINGTEWTKVGSITMTGTKSPASFNGQLPVEANNQKDLYIRLIADKTSNVDGAASANDGNTLAMFFITGTPKLVDDGVAPVLVATVPADGATGVSASGKIVLTFDERVKLAEGTKGMMSVDNSLGTWLVEPIVSGKTITFPYKGLEYGTAYTFTLDANKVSDLTDNFVKEAIAIHFTTMERPAIQKGMYDAVVSNVEELLAAISAAEARSDKNVRFRIFLKNGTYQLPLSTTATINSDDGNTYPSPVTNLSASNVSFIGESVDGVVVTNTIDPSLEFAGQWGTASVYDGIGKSDVLQIQSQVTGTYFQDLTIKSGMIDSRGRNIAVQDKGKYTIYKNTCLWGYQDTWTSNNDYGYYYFEGGKVRGRTDFLCGKGDAFFNSVNIQMCMNTGGYIAVPSKSIKYGYTFKDCTINGESQELDGKYTLGRPWGQGTPVALWIDTRMNIVPSAIGWNEMSGGWPARFAEYNSMTSTGSQIDLSGRKKVFGDGHENNPVLTAEEALEAGNLHNMFGEWDPTLATEQAPAPANVAFNKATMTISWENSDYAFCWAIVKDGEVIDFTTENSYVVDDASAVYAVRAANEMGGLGEAIPVLVGTGIESIEQPAAQPKQGIYDLQGRRIHEAKKGLFIIDGKKVVK